MQDVTTVTIVKSEQKAKQQDGQWREVLLCQWLDDSVKPTVTKLHEI
jgi:hypothetical protein